MKTNTFSVRKTIIACAVAFLMLVTMFVVGNVNKASAATTFTLNGASFTHPFGYESNYVQDGNVIKTKNGGGWQDYLTTTFDSGSVNYHYSITFKADKGRTVGENGEVIRFGLCLYIDDNIQFVDRNHLSVALQWSHDPAAPNRVKLHNVCFCDSFLTGTGSSIWTDNWQTFATGGAAELVPTDTVVCEVYRFRGSSTDEYGIRVNGQSVFTYNTAQSMSNNSTTHKVGFYAFHENPANGAATITISDFKTCANELKVNPTIELNSNCPKTGEVGTKIKVPSATIKGAFDRTATINPVVKLGTKKITLSSRSFTPTQAGEYTVTWEGADPWGVSATPLTETIVVSDTAADEGEEDTEGESEGGATGGCAMSAGIELYGAFVGITMFAGLALAIKAKKKRKLID